MQRPAGHAMPVTAGVLAAALAVAACSSAVPDIGQRLASGTPASAGASGLPPSAGPPGSPAESGSPTATTSPAAKTSPSPSSGPSLQVPPSPPPGCDASRWMTASVHVERALPLPPVPVVTSIRIGTHPDCGYDRIVVHLRGPVPGYDIKYVSRTAAGPAARMIATRGDHYLLLTLHPAQGHLPEHDFARIGRGGLSRAPRVLGQQRLRGCPVPRRCRGEGRGVPGRAAQRAPLCRRGRLMSSCVAGRAGLRSAGASARGQRRRRSRPRPPAACRAG